MANEIAKKTTIGNFLNFPNTQKFLEDNLRDKRTEFVSNLLALVDTDTKLAECDPNKVMLCAMNATALNLPLNKNLGFAYIIPYNGIPSFQIGYKGFIQLAIRSGMYEFLNACEIRENEIERNKVSGAIKFLKDNPEGKVIGYLAYLKLMSGFSASLYMTDSQVEAHAMRFSKMYQADKKNKTSISKWSDPLVRPKMALKTVLKGLLGTYGVLSPELIKAFEHDSEIEDEPAGNRNISDAEIILQTDQPESQKTKKVQI